MDGNSELLSLIERIESQQREVQREEALIRPLSGSIAEHLALLRGESAESVAGALKVALTEPARAEELLSNSLEVLARGRFRYTRQFLVEALAAIQTRLRSPLWLDNSVEFVEAVDQLQQAVDQLDSSRGMMPDSAILSQHLEHFQLLMRRLAHAREVSQFRTPFRTFIWGLPIWIGVVLSGRVGLLGGLVAFAILLAVTAVSYYLARRGPVGAPTRGGSRKRVFLTRISPRNNGIVLIWGFFAALSPILFAVEGRSSIVSFLSKAPAQVQVPSKVTAKAGEPIKVRTSIATTKSVLYRVRATLSAPVMNDVAAPEIGAIHPPRQTIDFQFAIPQGIPPGKYPAIILLEYSFPSGIPAISGRMLSKRTTESFVLEF
jgi:hypothetical protein